MIDLDHAFGARNEADWAPAVGVGRQFEQSARVGAAQRRVDGAQTAHPSLEAIAPFLFDTRVRPL